MSSPVTGSVKVQIECLKPLNKVVVDGQMVCSAGHFGRYRDREQTFERKVTVSGEEKTVKFTVNFKRKTVKIEGAEAAVNKFHLKSAIYRGHVENADGEKHQMNPRRYQTHDTRYRQLIPLLDVKSFLVPIDHENQEFKDFAIKMDRLPPRLKPHDIIANNSETLNYAKTKAMLFHSKRQGHTSLTVDEIQHFVKDDVVLKDITKKERKKLEKLMAIPSVDADSFKAKHYDFLLNVPSFEEPDDSTVTLAQTNSDALAPLKVIAKDNKQSLAKAQEIARATLMTIRLVEANQYARANSHTFSPKTAERKVNNPFIQGEHTGTDYVPAVKSETEGDDDLQPEVKATDYTDAENIKTHKLPQPTQIRPITDETTTEDTANSIVRVSADPRTHEKNAYEKSQQQAKIMRQLASSRG